MSNNNDVKLEVNARMIPAFLGVLLLAFDLFAVSVTFLDWGSPLSLWEFMLNSERTVYLLNTLVILAAVLLHLLEMGGPPPFRGKAILTLGTTGLLTGFNNLLVFFVWDNLSGVFVFFVVLSTLCAFAMAITDIVLRSLAKPNH